MRRSPLRRTGRVKPRRDTPRRREAPRWTAEDWTLANIALNLRSGSRCECCGGRLYAGNIERHHRIRRRDGGDRLSNLLIIRRTCHQYWTEHPALARDRGIILLTTDDPETVPVLWRGREWSLLDDDGNRTPTQPDRGPLRRK